ncbi:unnamed protein product [Durusdinium trenchii]|uniref:Uncharacterized protein n=1 Tax=Durusdinium trenchii TaxID=1381693 RepID=A0ABP0SI08_9DINO
MGGEGPCWLCEGRDSRACVICGPVATSTEGPSGEKLLGQDGWCALDDSKDERFGGWVQTSTEELHVQILQEAEAQLQQGQAEAALQSLQRALRTGAAQVASFRTITRSCRLGCSFRRRMPQELHCLTSMIRARCHLLQQDYTAVVEDCKQFGRLEEEILGTMRGEELKKAQEQVGLAEVAAFVQRLGCAAEIAVNCRTKVTQGLAFKMVVDHAERALKGLQPCPEHLLGLKPLRAHLHLSRAQACLELELWTKAKEDALAALRLDAGLREAEYFVRAADARSW